MSIASELERIRTAKSAIRSAVNEKGGNLSENQLLNDYAAAITALPEGGSFMDFYKCAAVYGPRTIKRIHVEGAGTTACNGDYELTDLTTESGGEVWKHMTADYYYFDRYDTWCIADNYETYTDMCLYINYGDGWLLGYEGGASEPVPTVSEVTVTLDPDVPKTWDGYKAVLDGTYYSFEETVTTGLSYTTVIPETGGVYSADAAVKVYLDIHPLLDEHTVYAVRASDGMKELVSGKDLTNSSGTVLGDGFFDFSPAGSVLDFPIEDSAEWHMGDFTMEVVCTPCQPSVSYTSIIATGDHWGNNAMMLRFGNQRNRSIGYFWNGVGDPVTQGGDIEYSNTEFRHMAIVRIGEKVMIFDNGNQVATASVNRVWNAASSNLIRLGALDISSAKYFGKIKWARISNIARYTSGFDASDFIA